MRMRRKRVKEPEVVDLKEMVGRPRTKRVIIRPRVLGDFLERAALHPWNEVAGLLLGRVHGTNLVVEDAVPVEEKGSAVRVRLSNAAFAAAAKAARPGQRVVGWVHSHPGHSVFMSGTDVATQVNGQVFFPDYVALVMDPFHDEGAAYGFYRVIRGHAEELDYVYAAGTMDEA